MTDSWLERHEDTIKDSLVRLNHNQLSASDCIQRFGITCDSPLDTWTKHFLKQEPHVKEIGDRLDYIFYRKSPGITCQQSKVVMEKYIPDTEWSYSDHFGVHSLFTIAGHVNSAIGDFAPASSQLARPDFTKLLPSQLKIDIDILQCEYDQAKKTSNGYLVMLFLSVLLMFGAYVAQIILPSIYQDDRQVMVAVNVVCGFFMIACSAVSMVCLIVGFVFGGTEQRSLDQYIIDLSVCLETLQRDPSTATTQSCLTTDGSSFSSKSSSSEEGLVVKHDGLKK